MGNGSKNIYPVYDRLLKRSDKEMLLCQHSVVIWLTGLSGAGKTTIANGVERKLYNEGYLSQILDGDNIRDKINRDLGFSKEDRRLNIIRAAEISGLFMDCGIIAINCFISPSRDIRQEAKNLIGEENFFEIYINCPLEICEKRDDKRLYERARSGDIKEFTGISSPYEEPLNPSLEIKTDILSIEDSINKLYNFILPKVNIIR
ncbi:MAG: adenylyl-sulfate kinase [Bacteroidota bacterium]|nr:adenylyl-sulfate kinase [Bacteroidota bacterium]